MLVLFTRLITSGIAQHNHRRLLIHLRIDQRMLLISIILPNHKRRSIDALRRKRTPIRRSLADAVQVLRLPSETVDFIDPKTTTWEVTIGMVTFPVR